MKFIPENLNVAPGDSIKWINKDIVTHNVAEEESGIWKSPDLQTGESFTIEISKSRTYICMLHPIMKGVITISEK